MWNLTILTLIHVSLLHLPGICYAASSNYFHLLYTLTMEFQRPNQQVAVPLEEYLKDQFMRVENQSALNQIPLKEQLRSNESQTQQITASLHQKLKDQLKINQKPIANQSNIQM